MGYAFVIGHCGACRKVFTFNPLYVPSLNNIPFCRECIEAANVLRKEKGMESISIHPEAYEPINEEQLP